jgi:type II secretion system protein D
MTRSSPLQYVSRGVGSGVIAVALVLLAGTAVGWQESSPAPSGPSPSSAPASPAPAPEAPAPAKEPSKPEPAPTKVAEKPAAPAAAPAPAKPKREPSSPVYKQLANGRRIIDGPPTALAFKNVTVDQIVPFIVDVTGKVVMPQQDVLTRKVTILSSQPIPREQALDRLIEGLQQNGVAVAEGESTIKLRDIAELTREDVPHIPPDESTLSRTDGGWFAEKVYQLKHTTAKAMGDVLKNALPDYAKMTVSDESNSIAILGNISLLQRIENLINSLDRPSLGAMQTQTFALRYTEATSVKDNINELFSNTSTTGAGANRRNQGNQGNRNGQNNNQGQQFRFPGQPGGQDQSTIGNGEIRVTANTQQNSVTVVADPSVLDQIRDLVENKWDLPVPADVAVTKIYELKYSDPVKVANMLNALMGRSTSSTQGGGGGGGGNQFNQFGQQQGGAPTVATGAQRLQNMFTIQPMADAGKLAVIAKSRDNLAIIDDIIKQIDQPQTIGLPSIVELKHASSEDLAEQLNTLLALDGTLAAITKSQSGLTENQGNTSPFASANANTAATTANGNTNNPDTVTPGTIQFWWQRSRTPTDRHPASNLIGQLRIVPVWRQNALMVIAPPEYKESIVKLIQDLDKPGRQVLIAAIVAEVSREDALNLGLRWSSQTLTPTNPDNSFSVGNSMTGTKNNFINSLFDTSVLTANANLNFLLQALAQKTDVSILSEPKIFTSDNQEAEFFDGQDVPFVTNSQTTTTGLVQSFDYRAVGIQLRARPRITVQGDVDLKVNLELSSIVPGQTLFGGFVVDRRETTTQLIVKDKQTIVISGILRSELSDIVRKVPLLGDIPLLGALFRSKDKTVKNTELLVFITPIVVVNTEQNMEMNSSYTDRLEKIKNRLKDSEPESLKSSAPEPELQKSTGPQMAPDNGSPGPHPVPDPK